jgi:hypothetical protein
MLDTLGAVRAATRQVAGDLGWEGFMARSLAGRLDRQVEPHVLKPEFAAPSDAEDRHRARGAAGPVRLRRAVGRARRGVTAGGHGARPGRSRHIPAVSR